MLSEWRASGLSVAAFSAKFGLRRNRINWWRKRLGDWTEEGPPAEKAVKLVRLVPSEVVASPARMRGAVTMRLPGGIELEFEDAQLSPVSPPERKGPTSTGITGDQGPPAAAVLIWA